MGIFKIKDPTTHEWIPEEMYHGIVDNTMSDTSENPVQNKVVKEYIDTIDRRGSYDSIDKVKDYLYEVAYNVLDYANAFKYYAETNEAPNTFACSTICKGNLYGRNFDLYYDESAEFIVKVPKLGRRHASIGVAHLVEITNEFVESGKYSELYKVLPFQMADGINDAGVVACMNIVSTEYGTTAMPTLTSEVEINALMLVRYILDYFSTAYEAVTYIQEHMTVFINSTTYTVHLMVADNTNTYVVEFINGITEVINVNSAPYMTNFHLYGTNTNPDGLVCTPATVPDGHLPTVVNGITPKGIGLERYNIIASEFESVTDKTSMRELLTELKYTRMYKDSPDEADPEWFTELSGLGELTVDSTPSDYADDYAAAGEIYAERTRSTAETEQTMHAAIYDITTKHLYIVVQEDGQELEFYNETQDVEQVQSDWEETDTSAPAYIKNKPVIPEPTEQVQANWNETDTTSKAYIQNKPSIPVPVPQMQSDWEQDDATQVDYIKNKPVIPEPTAQVQVDWNQTDTTAVDYIKNKPTIPAETPIATTQVTGKVKPDGTTITVDANGTISATGGSSEDIIASCHITKILEIDRTTGNTTTKVDEVLCNIFITVNKYGVDFYLESEDFVTTLADGDWFRIGIWEYELPQDFVNAVKEIIGNDKFIYGGSTYNRPHEKSNSDATGGYYCESTSKINIYNRDYFNLSIYAYGFIKRPVYAVNYYIFTCGHAGIYKEITE